MFGSPFQHRLIIKPVSGVIVDPDPPDSPCSFDPEEVDRFVIVFIDESTPTYTSLDGNAIGAYWTIDAETFDEQLNNYQKCATHIFHINTARSPYLPIWPESVVGLDPELPIGEDQITKITRPSTSFSQQNFYQTCLNTLNTRYGSDFVSQINSNNIEVIIIVDNSGSMQYALVQEAVDLLAENFDDYVIIAPCTDERWLGWCEKAHTVSILNALNAVDVCECYEIGGNTIDIWEIHKIVYLNEWDELTNTFTETVEYEESNGIYQIRDAVYPGFYILIPAAADMSTLTLYYPEYGLTFSDQEPSDAFVLESGYFYHVDFISPNIPASSTPFTNTNRIVSLSVSIGGCNHSFSFRHIINFIEV